MKIFKVELIRAIWNFKFGISIAIGIIITFAQFIVFTIPARQYLNLYESDSGLIPHSVFNQWFGSSTSVFLILYYLILPILCSYPHADSFYWDKKSGYWKIIITKCDKSNYLIAKFFAIFLSGGLIAVIPTAVNLFLNIMVLPAITPLPALGIYPIDATSMLSSLYYTNPFSYIGALFVLNFMGFGAISVIALPFSFVFTNRFMVVVSPFLVYYLVSAILDLIDFPAFSPMNFLRYDQPARGTSFLVSIVIIVSCIIISCGFFMYKGLKLEDL